MVAFVPVLEERLRARGAGFSNKERADFLKTERSAYSRLVNGRTLLTEKRASEWAKILYPGDRDGAAEFVRRLLDAGKAGSAPAAVPAFLNAIVDEGGAVAADRVAELFTALEDQALTKRLLCVEYRDPPRAAKSAKYEGVGTTLPKAIARGLHYAMFQPFGENILLPVGAPAGSRTQSLAVATFMLQVREKCRAAYEIFFREAVAAYERGEGLELPGDEKLSKAEDVIDRRLKLYERKTDVASLGSGLQAKMFYLQYQSADAEERIVRHQRLMQWVSTPTRDLLIYRGEVHIPAEVVRDTFYPVPHFFDVEGELPAQADTAADEIVRAELLGSTALLPLNYHVWKAYPRAGAAKP